MSPLICPSTKTIPDAMLASSSTCIGVVRSTSRRSPSSRSASRRAEIFSGTPRLAAISEKLIFNGLHLEQTKIIISSSIMYCQLNSANLRRSFSTGRKFPAYSPGDVPPVRFTACAAVPDSAARRADNIWHRQVVCYRMRRESGRLRAQSAHGNVCAGVHELAVRERRFRKIEIHLVNPIT